jgi:hypothetical protein
MVDTNRTFSTSRPLLGAVSRSPEVKATVAAPATAPVPAIAPTTNVAVAPEETRLQQQQHYLNNMWSQLGRDTRLAAIMVNPIFMVQSQAITSAAVATAIRRYETELPRQDFSVLYGLEMTKARTAILAMPDAYARYGEKAIEATGQVLLDSYDATTEAVTTAAVATGHAAKTGFNAVVGFFAMAGAGIVHGLGHVLHAIGNGFAGVGRRLETVGN